MIQLEPREYFTIVKQIGNHTDSTTYYVRATIRNARTDTIIDTVNLADKGNRRFSYNWQVPTDTSGLGFYVSILSEVFTDSGYTTKSSRYADEMNVYLVQTRNKLGGGGGGGTDVDYKKIAKIFTDTNKELLKSLPVPVVNVEKTDNGEVLKSLEEMKCTLNDICADKGEKIELEPIVALISGMHKEMCDSFSVLSKKEEEKDEEKEIDFGPIIESIREQKVGEIKENLVKVMESMKEMIEMVMEVQKCVKIEEKKEETKEDTHKIYDDLRIKGKVARLTRK